MTWGTCGAGSRCYRYGSFHSVANRRGGCTYGAVFEIKSLLALVVSVGPESKGKDFVALAGRGVTRPASSE
jgi:hypothetical protein